MSQCFHARIAPIFGQVGECEFRSQCALCVPDVARSGSAERRAKIAEWNKAKESAPAAAYDALSLTRTALRTPFLGRT